MSETSTEILIQRVGDGDLAALEALYDRYQTRVLAAVRIRLGAKLRQKVESWDIVQNVMMAALRKVESFDFRSEGAFLKYLNKLVENRIRDEADRWQAQKRDLNREVGLNVPRSPESSILLDIQAGSGVPTPSKIAAFHEDLEQLELAMDRLPEESRELLVAVKIEGRSLGELAEESDKSTDAVRMQVNRAMARLTESFRQFE